jgi:glucose-6-phosphate isomerase
LTVFGNKGSTDQHAYVQQLRDGLANFFGLFIWVIEDGGSRSVEVEEKVTSGDYLTGFLLGTRDALFERGRESGLLSLSRVDEFHIGVLIALFERVVGYYASLINVNAYHQPGVEAGKKAAGKILKVQQTIFNWLSSHPDSFFSATELSDAIGEPENADNVFRICEHLVANKRIASKNCASSPQAVFGRLGST